MKRTDILEQAKETESEGFTEVELDDPDLPF